MSGHKRGEPYEVGYARPPKESQFKKGHSGFRKSKRPKIRHPLRELAEVLLEKVTLTLDGERVTRTRQQWVLHALKMKAASGHAGAVKLLQKLQEKAAATKPEEINYMRGVDKFLKLVDARTAPEATKDD